eukprot:1137235-Pelagomonas_calceolata.AAC.8
MHGHLGGQNATVILWKHSLQEVVVCRRYGVHCDNAHGRQVLKDLRAWSEGSVGHTCVRPALLRGG